MKYLQYVPGLIGLLAFLLVPNITSAQETSPQTSADDFSHKMEGETYREITHRELKSYFGRTSPIGGSRGGTSG